MKRLMVIGLSAIVSAQALAVTPASQAALSRRQLSDCMMKEMAASRTMSYNEASKVCKDRSRSQGESPAAGIEAKPANAR